MRLLVVDDAYPSDANLNANIFVHVRVKAYRERYPDLQVVASFGADGPDYVFEGVPVIRAGSTERLALIARDINPDVILVHFATFPVIRDLIALVDVPYVIWSHGFDAVGWYRRLYEYRGLIHFLRFIKGNLVQRYYYRSLIRRANRSGRIHQVFVSEWLRRAAQTDALIKIRHSSVIPNPIDTHLFVAREKVADDRKKLLILRPIHKSGVDIMTDGLALLKDKPIFQDLDIAFYGEGVSGSRFEYVFSDCPNVTVVEGTVSHERIPDIHRRYGVYLSASHQDSHGVSMCEAMASGLVVITSNNSAIPESVEHGETGLLTDNHPASFAAAIERLYDRPGEFLAMSKAAPLSIVAKAGIDKVIEAELSIIEQMATLGDVAG